MTTGQKMLVFLLVLMVLCIAKVYVEYKITQNDKRRD
jgi:hypothetical protein